MDAQAVQTQQRHVPAEINGIRVTTIARVGTVAGIVAGMAMAMWQMIVGAIAQTPTAVEGINSSLWTAVTAIPSVVLGDSWFHGSFDLPAVSLGMMGHMMNSVMLGILGVTILILLLGPRPAIGKALAVGMMFGLLLEAVLVNGIVNGLIQSNQVLYGSTPEWSWWAAHAMFGAGLGLISTTLLRRERG